MASHRTGGSSVDETLSSSLLRPETGPAGGRACILNELPRIICSGQGGSRSGQSCCVGSASAHKGLRSEDFSLSADLSSAPVDHSSDCDGKFRSPAATPVSCPCTANSSVDPQVCPDTPPAPLSGWRPPWFGHSGASSRNASVTAARVRLAASSADSGYRSAEQPAEKSSAGGCKEAASLPSPFSIPSRLLLFLSSFLKEAFVSSIRRIVVGPLLKGLEEQQLHIALGKREVSVSHVQVQTAAANQLLAQAGVPVQFREIYVEQVQWLVPWRLRLKGLHAAVELVVDDDGTPCPDGELRDRYRCPNCAGLQSVGPPGDRSAAGDHQHRRDRSPHVPGAADASLEDSLSPEPDVTRAFSSHAHVGTGTASATSLGAHLPAHRHCSVPAESHGATRRGSVPKHAYRGAGARGLGMTHGSAPVSSARHSGTVYGQSTSEKISRSSGASDGTYTMDDILRMLRRAMQTAVGALDLSLEDITVSLFVPLLPDPRTDGRESGGRRHRREDVKGKSQCRGGKGIAGRFSEQRRPRGWVVRLHVEVTRVCEVGQEGSSVRLEIEGLSGSLLCDAPSVFFPSGEKHTRSGGAAYLSPQPTGGEKPLSGRRVEVGGRRFRDSSSFHESCDCTNTSSVNGSSRGDRSLNSLTEVSHSLRLLTREVSKVAEGGGRSVLLHRRWLEASGDLLFVTKPPVRGAASSLKPSLCQQHGPSGQPEASSKGSAFRRENQEAAGSSWTTSPGVNPLLTLFYSAHVGSDPRSAGSSAEGAPDVRCCVGGDSMLGEAHLGDPDCLSTTDKSPRARESESGRRGYGSCCGSKPFLSPPLLTNDKEAFASRMMGFNYGEAGEYMDAHSALPTSGVRRFSRIPSVPVNLTLDPAGADKAEEVATCAESEPEPAASYSICGLIHVHPRGIASASLGSSSDPARSWRSALGLPRVCSCLTAAIMSSVPRSGAPGFEGNWGSPHVRTGAPAGAASPAFPGSPGITNSPCVSTSASGDPRTASSLDTAGSEYTTSPGAALDRSCSHLFRESFSSCCGGEDLSQLLVSSSISAPQQRHQVVAAAIAAGQRAISGQATASGVASAAVEAAAAAGLDFAVHLRVPLLFSCAGIGQLRELVRLAARISAVLQPPLRTEGDPVQAGRVRGLRRHDDDQQEGDGAVSDWSGEEETACSDEERCQRVSEEFQSGRVPDGGAPVCFCRNDEAEVCSQGAAETWVRHDRAEGGRSQDDPTALPGTELVVEHMTRATHEVDSFASSQTDLKAEEATLESAAALLGKGQAESGPVVACGVSSPADGFGTPTPRSGSESEGPPHSGAVRGEGAGSQAGDWPSGRAVSRTSGSLWSRLLYAVATTVGGTAGGQEKPETHLSAQPQQCCSGAVRLGANSVTLQRMEGQQVKVYDCGVSYCPAFSLGGEEIVPRLIDGESGSPGVVMHGRGKAGRGDGSLFQPCNADTECVGTSPVRLKRDEQPACGELTGAGFSSVCSEVQDGGYRPRRPDPHKGSEQTQERPDGVPGWSVNQADGQLTSDRRSASASLPSAWVFHIEVECVRLHVVFSEYFRTSLLLRNGGIPPVNRALSRPEFLRDYSETGIHPPLRSGVRPAREAEDNGKHRVPFEISAPERLGSPTTLVRILDGEQDCLAGSSGRRMRARVVVPFPQASFITLVADQLVCSTVSSLPRCLTQAAHTVAACAAAAVSNSSYPAQAPSTVTHRVATCAPYGERGAASVRSFSPGEALGSVEVGDIRNGAASARQSLPDTSSSVFSSYGRPEDTEAPARTGCRPAAPGAAATSTSSLANATALHLLLSTTQCALEMHLLKKRASRGTETLGDHRHGRQATGCSEFSTRRKPLHSPCEHGPCTVRRPTSATVASVCRAGTVGGGAEVSGGCNGLTGPDVAAMSASPEARSLHRFGDASVPEGIDMLDEETLGRLPGDGGVDSSSSPGCPTGGMHTSEVCPGHPLSGCPNSTAPSDNSFRSVCTSDDNWGNGSDSSGTLDVRKQDHVQVRRAPRELDFEVFPLMFGVSGVAPGGTPLLTEAPRARSRGLPERHEVPWTCYPLTLVPFPLPASGETAFWSAHSLAPCSGGPCGRCCYARAPAVDRSTAAGFPYQSSHHGLSGALSQSHADSRNVSIRRSWRPSRGGVFPRPTAFATARKPSTSRRSQLFVPSAEGEDVFLSFHPRTPSLAGATMDDSFHSCQHWNGDRLSYTRDVFPTVRAGRMVGHEQGDSPVNEVLFRHVPVHAGEAPLLASHASLLTAFPSGGKGEQLSAPSMFLSISFFPSFHQIGRVQSAERLTSSPSCCSCLCPSLAHSCPDGQACDRTTTETKSDCVHHSWSALTQEPRKRRREFDGRTGVVRAEPYGCQSGIRRDGCDGRRCRQCAEGVTELSSENHGVQEGMLTQVNVKLQTTVVNLSLRALTEIIGACDSIAALNPACGGVEQAGFGKLPLEKPGTTARHHLSTACLSASSPQAPFPQMHVQLSAPCLRVNLSLEAGQTPPCSPRSCSTQRREDARSVSQSLPGLPSAVLVWDFSALRVVAEPDLLRLLFRADANGDGGLAAVPDSVASGRAAEVPRCETVTPETAEAALGTLPGGARARSLFSGGILHQCSPGTLLDVQQVLRLHFLYSEVRSVSPRSREGVTRRLRHAACSPGLKRATSPPSRARRSSQRPGRRKGDGPVRVVWRRSLLFATCVSGTASATPGGRQCTSENSDISCIHSYEADGTPETRGSGWGAVFGQKGPAEPSCLLETRSPNACSSQEAYLDFYAETSGDCGPVERGSSSAGRFMEPIRTDDGSQALRAYPEASPSLLFAVDHLPVVPPSRVVLRCLVREVAQRSGRPAVSHWTRDKSELVEGRTSSAHPTDELCPFGGACSWSASVDPGFWPDAAAPVPSNREPLPPCPDFCRTGHGRPVCSNCCGTSASHFTSTGTHSPALPSSSKAYQSTSRGNASGAVANHGAIPGLTLASSKMKGASTWDLSGPHLSESSQARGCGVLHGEPHSSARFSSAGPSPTFGAVNTRARVCSLTADHAWAGDEHGRAEAGPDSVFFRSSGELTGSGSLQRRPSERPSCPTSARCGSNDTRTTRQAGAWAILSRDTEGGPSSIGREDPGVNSLGTALQTAPCVAGGDRHSAVGFPGSCLQAGEAPGLQLHDDSGGDTAMQEWMQRRHITVEGSPNCSPSGGSWRGRALASKTWEEATEMGVHFPIVYVPVDVPIALVVVQSALAFSDSLRKWRRQWRLCDSKRMGEGTSVREAAEHCFCSSDRPGIGEGEALDTSDGDVLTTSHRTHSVSGRSNEPTCSECIPQLSFVGENAGVGTAGDSQLTVTDAAGEFQVPRGALSFVEDGPRLLQSIRLHVFVDAAVAECSLDVSSACRPLLGGSRVGDKGTSSPVTAQVSAPSQTSGGTQRSLQNALNISELLRRQACDGAAVASRLRLELGRLRLHLGAVEKVNRKRCGCGAEREMTRPGLSRGDHECSFLRALLRGFPFARTLTEKDDTGGLLSGTCRRSPCSRLAAEERNLLDCRPGGRGGRRLPCTFQAEASAGSVCLFGRNDFPVFYTWRAALYQAAGKGRADPGAAGSGMDSDGLSMAARAGLHSRSMEPGAGHSAAQQAPLGSTRGEAQPLKGVLGETPQIASDPDNPSSFVRAEPDSFFTCLLPQNSLVFSLQGHVHDEHDPVFGSGNTNAGDMVKKRTETTDGATLSSLPSGQDRIPGASAALPLFTSGSLPCSTSCSVSSSVRATLRSAKLGVGWVVAVADVRALECMNLLLSSALIFTHLDLSEGRPDHETRAVCVKSLQAGEGRDDECRTRPTVSGAASVDLRKKSHGWKGKGQGSFADGRGCGLRWARIRHGSCEVTVHVVRSVFMLPRPDGLTGVCQRAAQSGDPDSWEAVVGQSCSVCPSIATEASWNQSSSCSAQCRNYEGMVVGKGRRDLFLPEACCGLRDMGWVAVFEVDGVYLRAASERHVARPLGKHALRSRECLSAGAGNCLRKATDSSAHSDNTSTERSASVLSLLEFRLGEVTLHLIDEGTGLATSARGKDLGTGGVTSRTDEQCRDTAKLLRSVPPPSSLLPRLIPVSSQPTRKQEGRAGRSLVGLSADYFLESGAQLLAPLVVRAADISPTLRAIGLVCVARVRDLEGAVQETACLAQRGASSLSRDLASGLQVRVGSARFAFCPDSLRCLIRVAVDSSFVAALWKDIRLGVTIASESQFSPYVTGSPPRVTSGGRLSSSCKGRALCFCVERFHLLLLMLLGGGISSHGGVVVEESGVESPLSGGRGSGDPFVGGACEGATSLAERPCSEAPATSRVEGAGGAGEVQAPRGSQAAHRGGVDFLPTVRASVPVHLAGDGLQGVEDDLLADIQMDAFAGTREETLTPFAFRRPRSATSRESSDHLSPARLPDERASADPCTYCDGDVALCSPGEEDNLGKWRGPAQSRDTNVTGKCRMARPSWRSSACFEGEGQFSVTPSGRVASQMQRGAEEDKLVGLTCPGRSQCGTADEVPVSGTGRAPVREASAIIEENYVAAPVRTQNKQPSRSRTKIAARDTESRARACRGQQDGRVESRGISTEPDSNLGAVSHDKNLTPRLSAEEMRRPTHQEADARRETVELSFATEGKEQVCTAETHGTLQPGEDPAVRFRPHSWFSPSGKNGRITPREKRFRRNGEEECPGDVSLREHSRDFSSSWESSGRPHSASGTDTPRNTPSTDVSSEGPSWGWPPARALPPEGSVHWTVGAPGSVDLRPHFGVSGAGRQKPVSPVSADAEDESFCLERAQCSACVDALSSPSACGRPVNHRTSLRNVQDSAHSDTVQHASRIFRTGTSPLPNRDVWPVRHAGPWRALVAELSKRGQEQPQSANLSTDESKAIKGGWRFAAQLLLARLELNLAKGADFGCFGGSQVPPARMARGTRQGEGNCCSSTCSFLGTSSYGGSDQGDRDSKSGRGHVSPGHMRIACAGRDARDDVVEIVLESVAVVYGHKGNVGEKQRTQQTGSLGVCTLAESGDLGQFGGQRGTPGKAASVASWQSRPRVRAGLSAACLPSGPEAGMLGDSAGRNRLLCLKVHEFCVKDLVPNSMFAHMVRYYSDDRTRPRISSVPMLSVTLEEYRLSSPTHFPSGKPGASGWVHGPERTVGSSHSVCVETEGWRSGEFPTPLYCPVQNIPMKGSRESSRRKGTVQEGTGTGQENVSEPGPTSGGPYWLTGVTEQIEAYKSEYAVKVRLLPLALTLQQESLDAIEEMNQQMLSAGIVARSQALMFDETASRYAAEEEKCTTSSFSVSSQRRLSSRSASSSSHPPSRHRSVGRESTTDCCSSSRRRYPLEQVRPGDEFHPGADWSLVPLRHSPAGFYRGATQPGAPLGLVRFPASSRLSAPGGVDNDSYDSAASSPIRLHGVEKAHHGELLPVEGGFPYADHPGRGGRTVTLAHSGRERGLGIAQVSPGSENVYKDVLTSPSPGVNVSRPCSFHNQQLGYTGAERTGKSGDLFGVRDNTLPWQQVTSGRTPQSRAGEKPAFSSVRPRARAAGQTVSDAFSTGLPEREVGVFSGSVSGAPGVMGGENSSFFRSFDMAPALLRIDYVPRRLDPAGICNGQLQEVVNFLVSFCRVEGLEVILTRKSLADLSSWGALLDQLLASWTEDFNRALMLKCMKGITPFRHVLRATKMMKNVAHRLLKASVHRWHQREKPSGLCMGHYSQCGRSLRDWMLEPGGGEIPQISRSALRHIAALLVAASAEGIWWSERAVRSAHSVLQLVDWRYTPGTCPTYPSSTSRLRAGSFSGAYGYAKEDGIAGDFERRVLALTSEPGRQRSNRTAVPLRRERWRTFGCGKADGWSGRARLRSFSETTSDRRPLRVAHDSEAGLTTGDGQEHHLGSGEWAVVQLGAEGSYEPSTFAHGLRDGFCCIRRGVTSAAEAAERLCLAPSPASSSFATAPRGDHGPCEDFSRRVPAAIVGREFIHALAQLLPIFILRPMLGLTEGITRTLQGTRNQLLPGLREERFGKLRKPSCRLRVFNDDDQDGDGVTPL